MAIAENDGYSVLKHMYCGPKNLAELKALGVSPQDFEVLVGRGLIFDIDKTNKSPIYTLAHESRKYVEQVTLKQYPKQS